jgi:hypothetical protein
MCMGGMRARAMEKAKHSWVINLDIDDQLLEAPKIDDDIFVDFIGLGWIENGECKDYWLPGEKRSELNTIRSNFMVNKDTTAGVAILDKDFYVYDYLRQLYLGGALFGKTTNYCVMYDKYVGSLSSDPTSEEHERAINDLRRLERTVR